ncbi:MAG: rod shape-determining protein MreC [Alcaligenaceae bacterium]|jgi:rod shape-determining protein MreC|nr:rod shape-determining protein MreC [Alcaligenaceae bacterium]HZJ97727.1 rod shape-determining protein MreC [Oligella sp.]
MSTKKSPSLFRQGIASEVKLFFLALLCVVLIIVDANWSFLEPVRRLSSTLMYPFQRIALWPKDVVNSVYDWSKFVTQTEEQIRHTESARIENARLNMRAMQMETENVQLRRLLGVRETVDVPSVAVEVLYTPAHPSKESIVLNKGSIDGIEPGMPVIAEGGIVGQIRRVTPKTSEAALVTDDKTSVPALLKRNGIRVLVFGSGQPGQIEVRYLSLDVDIKVGDELVSSGIGGYYPAGLMIGEITSIETNSAQGFVRAIVEPSAHPDRHRHFLVLLHTPIEEIDETALLED